MAPELLWKGLFVSATFDVDKPTDPKKKAPTQKALKSLSIDSLEIEGTVVEIGDDFIIINAKPLKGDWPDSEPPKNGSAPLAKAVKPRAIKFKTIEKVTRVLNKELRATELGEYTKDEKVEAVVGVGKGKAQGLLLTLHPPVIDHSKEDKRTAQQPKPIIPKNSGGSRKAGG
ncbi:MAG TPA: hypothetical protein VMV81_11190 [Phycisphaerae bacterium]|nr:hypothetical protein [Phycisphaerae bacterium]